MSNAPSEGSKTVRRVVINDASCLIDLHKVGLVEVMLQLPYDFVVALPVAYNEVLDFTDQDWGRFSECGLEQVDLDPNQTGRAIAHRSQHNKLTAEDCFSLVLAEEIKDSILLTGDAELRNVAVDKGCEVHGVIWVADQIHSLGLIDNLDLAACLEVWLNDPLVRLPAAELSARLRLLESGVAEAPGGNIARPVGSPNQQADRYFRTEVEVVFDQQPLAVGLSKGADSRLVSTRAITPKAKPQKTATRAPAPLRPKDAPKINQRQPSQKLVDPLPYFVREVGGASEKVRSSTGKPNSSRGRKL